jgi:hypothetical protein
MDKLSAVSGEALKAKAAPGPPFGSLKNPGKASFKVRDEKKRERAEADEQKVGARSARSGAERGPGEWLSPKGRGEGPLEKKARGP